MWNVGFLFEFIAVSEALFVVFLNNLRGFGFRFYYFSFTFFWFVSNFIRFVLRNLYRELL